MFKAISKTLERLVKATFLVALFVSIQPPSSASPGSNKFRLLGWTIRQAANPLQHPEGPWLREERIQAHQDQ